MTEVARPGWDKYFMGIAHAVSARGECLRRQVGALLVLNNRLLDAGYNGAPPGESSCLDGACPRAHADYYEVPSLSNYESGPGTCIALHAEVNAIASAAQRGHAIAGATLYVTYEPCTNCQKLIRAAGLVRVVWPDGEWSMS